MEYIVRKGEISPLYGTYFSFKMSSAICFNLDQSKILSSGNEISTRVDVSYGCEENVMKNIGYRQTEVNQYNPLFFEVGVHLWIQTIYFVQELTKS